MKYGKKKFGKKAFSKGKGFKKGGFKKGRGRRLSSTYKMSRGGTKFTG